MRHLALRCVLRYSPYAPSTPIVCMRSLLRVARRPLATRAERDAARAAASAPPSPAASAAHFAALFSALQRGLEAMAAVNEGFSCVASVDHKLLITTGRAGEEPWVLEGDLANGLLTYSSFKVGEGVSTKYRRDVATGAWVGTEDGHFLLELLTRDLIHNNPSKGGLRGFPVF